MKNKRPEWLTTETWDQIYGQASCWSLWTSATQLLLILGNMKGEMKANARHEINTQEVAATVVAICQ